MAPLFEENEICRYCQIEARFAKLLLRTVLAIWRNDEIFLGAVSKVASWYQSGFYCITYVKSSPLVFFSDCGVSVDNDELNYG